MIIHLAESDPVSLILAANGTSIGRELKRPNDVESWLRALLIAEDSTVENLSIVIEDTVRRDVASHLVRHTAYHPRHVVQSGRPDWTGKPRSTDPATPTRYYGRWNAKSLIEASKQRLCYRAMIATQAWFVELKHELLQSDHPELRALGFVLVPYCVYRHGCPFGKRGCGWYGFVGKANIEERYEATIAEF